MTGCKDFISLSFLFLIMHDYQAMDEVRDAIHGFIQFNDWEREIINHPAFQRLRRIRQLGMSDLVYPGTTHTRFEHSLGVMHLGSKIFDNVILRSECNFNKDDIERDRIIVRLACLLHDIGHSPFSHAGEEFMPNNNDTSFTHEDYSAGIIRFVLNDVIENHPLNKNYNIKADEVARLIVGPSDNNTCRYWHNIISSQLDADRSDYLLRDSYYAGVKYGVFDLDRILVMTTLYDKNDSPSFAIKEDGINAAEALIIARYMMFKQVYFQETRRICDFHANEYVKKLLNQSDLKGVFPEPTSKENLQEYLKWDDFYVWGQMTQDRNDRHVKALFERRHDRCIYCSTVFGEKRFEENEKIERWKEKLKEKNIELWVDNADSNWYKRDTEEIKILMTDGKLKNLSQLSQFLINLEKSPIVRLYVPVDSVKQAKEIIKE